MKTRTLVLLVAFLAVSGFVGYTAWEQRWFQTWFARDSVNAAEVARLEGTQIQNDAPPDAATGSPQWRGALRKGVAAAGSFRTDWEKNPPKELWRAPVGGGYGSCSVADGKLFVQDKPAEGKERVVCLDAGTGKQLWEYAYDSEPAGKDGNFATGPRATPAVAGNAVYTVGGAGVMLALEFDGGAVKLRWRHDLLGEFGAKMPQWGVACSPLVLGDKVVVTPGGAGAAVVAFDRNTGEVRWKAGSNPPGYSSPVAAAVGGQETVFAFMGDALLAVRAADGKLTDEYRWETRFNGNIATPLVLDDKYVFISSSYGMGSALLRPERSGDDVKLVEVCAARERRPYQNHLSTSVYKDRYLFGVDGEKGAGGLKCVSIDNKLAAQEWDGSEIGQANLILAGDHLVVQTDRGDLCLVEANPKEFNLVARIPKVLSGKNNWSTPTMVDGRLYLRDEEKVVCLDVRP